MINLIQKLDKFQYRHKPTAFTVAVVRRYSKDRGGRSASLLAYYVFLSLFPLLFWLSLLSNILNSHFPGASASLIHGATSYFPVLGQQLTKVTHETHTSFIAIIVSGLVTLYGARGTAMVFREIVSNVFAVPENERVGFPHNWLRGAGIVIIGGGGFVLTAAGYGWALAQGHSSWFRVLITLIGLAFLTVVFGAILKLSLPAHYKVRRTLGGAISMAIALGSLQLFGGFIVTHELKHYTDTYSALFATTLGLIAWIYLEAQILLYSIEITVVASNRLWPVRIQERSS